MDRQGERNDKIMDIIIEEAAEKCACDIENDDFDCDMTPEEEQNMLAMKDEIFGKVLAKIESEEKEQKQENNIRKMPNRKLIICVAIIALLAVGALSVSALRVFVFKTSASLNGDTLIIKTEKIDSAKYDVIQEFEEKDTLIVPDWLPHGMELKKITDDTNEVIIQFGNDDEWVNLIEDVIPIDGQSEIMTENNQYKVRNIEVLDMPGILLKMTGELDTTTYSAMWNSDTTQYTIDSNVSEKEFNAILNTLKFLK